MAIVNRFNVNKQQVTLDADIIENMSANDVSYDNSIQYNENTVGEKLNTLEQKIGQTIISGTYSSDQTITKDILIPTGSILKNNGIPIIIASDTNLSNRYDLKTGEVYTTPTNITFIKSSNTSGYADLYLFGTFLIYTNNIQNNSITKDKLDNDLDNNIIYKKCGKNLFDINSIIKNKIINSDGDCLENEYYSVSSLIPIKQNTDYIISDNKKRNVMGSGYALLLGNDKKTVNRIFNENKFNSGDDGYYLQFSIFTNYSEDDVLLCEGSIRSIYYPYTDFVDEEQKYKIEALMSKKIDAFSFKNINSINIFDKSSLTYGYLSNGSIVQNNIYSNVYRTSDYIPVTSNKTYYFKNIRFVETYNDGYNNTKETYDFKEINTFTLEIEDDVKFIRATCYAYYQDSAMICPDSLPSIYTPFGIEIPYINNKVKEDSFINVSPSINLFFPERVVKGYLNNDVISSNDYYNTTEYIKVLPKTTYCFSYAKFISEYDINKIYISDTYVDKNFEESSSIVTTYSTEYIRVTFRKNDNYRAIISKDTLPDKYVSSKIHIPYIEHTKSKHYGKNMVCFGDSITACVNERDNNNWCMQIDESLGINTTNQGYWSGRIAHASNNSEVKEAFSLFNLVDSIISGDWTKQQIIYETEGYEEHAKQLDKLKQIDFSTIDFISIALGTNDLSSKTPFEINGEPLSINSINGALRYSIKKLLETYPKLKFLIMTPIYRFTPSTGEDYIIDGIGIQDFVDDFLNLGKELKIPVIDMFNEIGVNKWNREYYWGSGGGDGLHPNYNMKILMGQKIASALNSIY